MSLMNRLVRRANPGSIVIADDLGHLEVETTIDDPGAYSKPWTLKWVAELRPDDDIIESICNEYNRDVKHLIGK